MFILHGGQVTGPFDPNEVAAKAVSRSFPADAMMGPSPQGPWMPVYAVASATPTGQIGTLPGLAIIAVASVALTAVLVWTSNGRKSDVAQAPVVTEAPAPPPAPPAPTTDGRGGIRRAVCPMKAFPCSVSGPDGTVMTKDARESLNQMGFLSVRCPTGQEWRAPTFARVP